MKLLKKYLQDERIELNDGEIKLSVRPSSTSQQARLADLSMASGVAARVEQTNWCLRNLIEKVSIAGAEFNSADLCDSADLSDDDTVSSYIKIGKLVTDNAFAKEGDLKKSQPQPVPGA
jgi:hypothetical protein